MSPSARTVVAGVVGNPVRHSKSPVLHNAAFRHLGSDWTYVAFEVPEGHGDRIVESMRTFGLGGLSVTMPFKQAVAAAADRVTPAVERLGVANTLFWDGDEIVADSTDGDGLVAAHHEEFGSSLNGRAVAVIGAGGAARSIIEAVGRAGASDIAVVNRTAATAADAAELAAAARVAEPDAVRDCHVVINATSVGMDGGPDPDSWPIDPRFLREGHEVVDIVYQPARTPLMRIAEDHGARVTNGLGMLIHQAGLQIVRFTGVEPPLGAMRQALDLIVPPR